MFGMGDMGMGMGMEMNGMMDMAEGAMLMDMGMPGLGAMDMGIGAMQMGMGQTMMDVGMMGNMYGGYGMGYGMGYGGMMGMNGGLGLGCMGLGCTLGCCNPGMYRRGPCMGMGCTLPCCRPRRRFGNCMGVGCTLPCCSTTNEVIIIDGNRGGKQYQQFQNNNYRNQYQNGYQVGYQNLPQNQQVFQRQYQNQGQNQYKTPNQPNVQYINSNQQTYRQNFPQNDQQTQQQSFQQPQVKVYQPQQNQLNSNRPQQYAKTTQQQANLYPKIQQYIESSYIPNQGQTQNQINQSIADQSVQQYKSQHFPSEYQQKMNKINLDENAVYHGKLFKRVGFSWTEYPQAILTRHQLLDMSVQSMTKVKVKMDATHQNTSFLKITTFMTQDHFFGCYQNQQLDWFTGIIWAKMALINKASDRFAQFNGHIEGEILRKSQFLGNWEHRFIRINSSGLKSYRNPHHMPTLSLIGIKELWTRFEFVHGGSYLVIKCKADGIKYQYGIPVQYAFPWIRAFYSILV